MEPLGLSSNRHCNITGKLSGIVVGIKLTGNDIGTGENGNFQNFSGDEYCYMVRKNQGLRMEFGRWKEEMPGDVHK